MSPRIGDKWRKQLHSQLPRWLPLLAALSVAALVLAVVAFAEEGVVVEMLESRDESGYTGNATRPVKSLVRRGLRCQDQG